MSAIENYQNLINHCNTEITTFTNEILSIDNEHPSNQDVANYLISRKTNLQNHIAFISQRKNMFQEIYDREIAKLNSVFTSEQQVIVDTIDSQYSSYMDNLKKMDSSVKDSFFSLYQNAETDIQKTCIINNFFNIL